MLISRSDRGALARWWFTIDRALISAVLLLMAMGVLVSMAASPPVAERIGLDYKKGEPVNVGTANGVARGWRIRLASVRINDVEVREIEAVVTPNAIVAVGEGIVSVLGTGAKKTKYATCPVPSKPVRLLAIADGVLLGGQQGLFHSTDGLEWKQISSAPVMALVDSKSGPLVVSPKAEVFALRH